MPPSRQQQNVTPTQRPEQAPTRNPTTNRGNAARQDQVRAAQTNGAAGTQSQRQTPLQQFNTAFDQQRGQAADPNQRRWAALTEAHGQEYAAWLEAKKAEPNTPLPAGLRGLVTPGATQGQDGYVQRAGNRHYQYGLQGDEGDSARTRSDLIGDSDQFYSRAFVESKTTKDAKTGKETTTPQVRVLKPDGTVGLMDANKDGMVELPASGFGFGTHNRNDVNLPNGRPQGDQWGRPESIARTMNTMADYATLFPGSSLSIGDLSDPAGSSPLLNTGSTTRHGSHYHGSQADLQYPSANSSSATTPTSGDDLFRMRSLMRLGEGRGFDNYYAGTGLNGKLFPGTDTSVGYNRDHNDHLHMGAGRGRV